MLDKLIASILIVATIVGLALFFQWYFNILDSSLVFKASITFGIIWAIYNVIYFEIDKG